MGSMAGLTPGHLLAIQELTQNSTLRRRRAICRLDLQTEGWVLSLKRKALRARLEELKSLVPREEAVDLEGSVDLKGGVR